MEPLQKVLDEIAKYEHPFFDFSATEKDDGVELCIRSKVADVLSPEYRICVAVPTTPSMKVAN